MARPRSFDPDTTLDAALQCFWKRGYEATSLSELITATGLQKGSLYNAFGDKHALFLAALDRYLGEILATLGELFGARGAAVDRIERWLRWLEGNCRGVAGELGCFASNAAAELANDDPEVRQRVAAFVEQSVDGLAKVLADGQRDGMIRDDVPSRELARTLWTLASGLRFAARSGARRADIKRQIAATRRLIAS